MLFSFEGVNFSYGGNSILKDATLSLHEGERAALVGENGSGKTTLIKLLTGILVPDGGQIAIKNGVKIGYAEQDGGYVSANTVMEEMRLALSEQFEAVERLNALSQKLSSLEYGGGEYIKLSAKIEALNRYISSHDSYNAEVKIKTVLGGMGFENCLNQVVDTMSGGEKTRLKLARLLLEEPDLLVLDEPTNHLDLNTLSWLEGYLATFKGAVLTVSHDRYFLDRVAGKVFEIEDRQVYSYAGNYTKYKALKEERIARQLKEYEAQQEEIKKLQTYVDKNIVRATTARSAQSRVKQLERMQLIQKPYQPPRPPRFEFTYDQHPAEEVLTIRNLKLCAGKKTLVDDLNMCVKRGQKLAIIGENGTGKSTLLHAIVGEQSPQINVGRYVNFAFYDQEMANLNPLNTVLQELWERHVAFSQTEVRARLARCGLYPEDIDKRVEELSGGERAKLAMCVFESANGNVLILDEPTNHLDLPARESLEEALKKFDGTVIFVSHDRYFISAVADGVAEIKDGAFAVYEGGYEGYLKEKEKLSLQERQREEQRAIAEYERNRESSYRSKKERAAEERKKTEIKAVEADISACELQEEELSAMLADPAVTVDYTKLSQVLKQLEKVRAQLEILYARYGELIC